VAVAKAFIEAPTATLRELAAAAGVDDATVYRAKRDPRFWRLIARAGLGESIGALADAVLYQGLAAAEAGKMDDATRERWVQLGAKRAGLLRDGVAVAVAVGGGAADAISARIAAAADGVLADLFPEVSPPKQDLNGETSADARVADSRMGREQVPGDGPAGGGQ
jgi:hypothetical protein